MEQATNRLQLRNAARRLYTEDGTLILDIQDLVDWVIDYYRRELTKMEATSRNNFDKVYCYFSVKLSIFFFILKSCGTKKGNERKHI